MVCLLWSSRRRETPSLTSKRSFLFEIKALKNIPEARSIVSLSERTNCLSLKIPGNELYEYKYFEFFKGYDSPRALEEKSLTAIADIE